MVENRLQALLDREDAIQGYALVPYRGASLTDRKERETRGRPGTEPHLKAKAILLRRKGVGVPDISAQLGIPTSTVYRITA